MKSQQFRRPLSFRENLSRLPNAFSRGFGAECLLETRSIVENQEKPFSIVGSGASFSAAVFITRFIEFYFSIPCRSRTPFEFYGSPPVIEGAVLVSASGENHDILASLDYALARELSPIVLVSGNKDNTLIRRASDYPGAVTLVTGYEIPGEREGFFGVQSLLAAIAAFLGMISDPRGEIGSEPGNWCATLCREAENEVRNRSKEIDRLANAEHTVALGSGWSLPCMIDLESKFVEGGLGWIEISEVKNFTHGRYINSLRHPNTSLICLSADEGREVFHRIESNISGNVAIVYNIFSKRRGVLGCIELFMRMFYLVDAIAERRRVNISRPFVPQGARRLFRGDDLYPGIRLRGQLANRTSTVIRLKKEVAVACGIPPDRVSRAVVEASLCFLYGICFQGLACDYDGTLVSLNSRDDKIGPALLRLICKLLTLRVKLAVISGRGKSVVHSLREQIPIELLPMVSCYLYNGAVLWNCGDESPTWVKSLDGLESIAERLSHVATRDQAIIKVEASSLGSQVTAHLLDKSEAPRIVSLVEGIATQEGWHAKVRTSGRSVDVFPQGVSKRTALDDFKINILNGDFPKVLAIGDRGDDQGNDAELLQEQFSLSVDKISWRPTCCFPVVDNRGTVLSGPLATAAILGQAHAFEEGFFTLSPCP